MTVYGQEMIAEIEQLRQSGSLSTELTSGLTVEAQALVDAGQVLEQDGKDMQQTAEDLLRSIGR